MEISVRPLSDGDWPAALALLHRAFVDEPFTVEMYGQEVPGRWAGSWALYSPMLRASYSLAIGAYAGDVLVGALVGSRPGHCHLCQVLALESRPEDPLDAIEWQFHQNIAEVHRTLSAHAWVDKVATEQALRGHGIGRLLLDSAADALKADAPTELVLECAPDRTSFYTGHHFEQVATFVDPAGPDAMLMSRRIR